MHGQKRFKGRIKLFLNKTKEYGVPIARSQDTRETCSKLHGKEVVLSKMGGFKNLPPKNSTRVYLSAKEAEEFVEKSKPTVIPDLGELNAEKMSKLKTFLKTFQGESCSLAQVSMCFNSEISIASKTTRNELWILDSGVIDHITPNLKTFETYESINSSRKITVANSQFLFL